MKVGTQQGDHQSDTSTKALTDQGHHIDDIMIIASTLNTPYLLLHLSLILMMAVKVIVSIITGQQQQKIKVFLLKLGKLAQM